MRNTLPLCSLSHGKSTSKILWLLAYRKNGTSATVLHAYRAALCPRNADKENYESDYKQNSSWRVYLRASNWSIIPTPTTWASLLTHRRRTAKLRTTDAREPKSGALLDRFFPRKRAKKNSILNSHSPFFPHVSRIGRPSPSFHCSPCRVAPIITHLRRQISYFFPLTRTITVASTNGKSIYRFGNSGFNRFKRRRRLVVLTSARPYVSAFIRTVFRVKTADD